MCVKTVMDLRGLRHLDKHRVNTKSTTNAIDKAYPWDISGEKAGQYRRVPVRMINNKVKKELTSRAMRLGFACPCRMPIIMYQVGRTHPLAQRMEAPHASQLRARCRSLRYRGRHAAPCYASFLPSHLYLQSDVHVSAVLRDPLELTNISRAEFDIHPLECGHSKVLETGSEQQRDRHEFS